MIFTQAIKQAVVHIIRNIRDAQSQQKLCLIYYGVSGIGKSTLAGVLDYFMGKMFQHTWLMTLHHQAGIDPNHMLEHLMCIPGDAPVKARNLPSCFLTLDKVNTDNLPLGDFLHILTDWKHPLVIMTSGHFVPGIEWVESGRCISQVIHLEFTEEETQLLLRKELWHVCLHDKTIKRHAKHIMKVTKVAKLILK